MIPDSKTNEIISKYYKTVELSEALSNPNDVYILKDNYFGNVISIYEAITNIGVNRDMEDFPPTKETDPNVNHICMPTIKGTLEISYPDIDYGTKWTLMKSNIYEMPCNINCKDCIYKKEFTMYRKCKAAIKKRITCEQIDKIPCQECKDYIPYGYLQYCTRPKDFDENKR